MDDPALAGPLSLLPLLDYVSSFADRVLDDDTGQAYREVAMKQGVDILASVDR